MDSEYLNHPIWETFTKNLERGKFLDFSDLVEDLEDKDEVHALQSLYARLTSFFLLEDLIKDESLNEILIFSPRSVCADFQGKLEPVQVSNEFSFFYQQIIQLILWSGHQECHHQKPFASFFLTLKNHQFRVSLTHPCLNPQKLWKVSFRRIKNKTLPLDSFLPDPTSIKQGIEQKKNILFCGATGSGKSTLLKSCLAHIPEDEHLIILEETHEITPLKSSHSNFLSEDSEESLKNLCRYALRLRPDRLILGEIRGSEITPFLLGLNTGHSGCLTTIHSSSAQGAIERAALLLQVYGKEMNLNWNQAMKLVTQNIDWVVFLKKKKVQTILQVLGSDQDQVFFEELYINPNESVSYTPHEQDDQLHLPTSYDGLPNTG